MTAKYAVKSSAVGRLVNRFEETTLVVGDFNLKISSYVVSTKQAGKQ